MVLQAIRERLTGVLAFVILGILIVPFALVGVNQYFTASDSNIVARINDTDISSINFNRDFSEYRRRMQSILGEDYDPLKFDQLSVRRQFLDSLIDEELIAQATQSMGLDVDDETLAEEIRKIPAFQLDGQFNSDIYESRVYGQGLSPRQFQTRLRAQIAISQLPRNITTSSIATPAELKEFIALHEQSRTFSAAMAPAVIPATTPEFDEEEILNWYESHADSYRSKEQVIVDYIELDAALLPASPPPEEDFLRDQFEAQKGRFLTPEQRRVAHIMIETPPGSDEAVKETAKQTAQDLSRRAMAGEDFAVLAAEYSQDAGSAAEGGELGWVEPGVMVKAFENAMYQLSLAAPVSEAIETGFGWHVIKLLDIRESTGMSFDEARSQLVAEYQEDKAARAFLEQADRLVDLIYEDPTTLDSAALVLGLSVKTAGPFTRDGGEGIAANSEVVEASFSDLVLLQGSVSDPINLDENRLVMIKLNEYLPVALIPLDEVRNEIVATLSDKRARDSAEARAAELLAALQLGESSFEALAAEAGMEYSFFEAIRRDSVEPDVTLVEEIFRLQIPPENASVQVVLPSGDGFAVVELESVVNGEIEAGAVLAHQQYERVLSNSRASQEAFALVRQLRAAADLKIYEERIQ